MDYYYMRSNCARSMRSFLFHSSSSSLAVHICPYLMSQCVRVPIFMTGEWRMKETEREKKTKSQTINIRRSVAYSRIMAHTQPTLTERTLNRWRHIESVVFAVVLLSIYSISSFSLAGWLAGLRLCAKLYEMRMKQRMEPLIWCNCRQDVGTHGYTHDCRSSGNIAQCARTPDNWLRLWYTLMVVIGMVAPIRERIRNQRTIWFTILSSYFFWTCTFIVFHSSTEKMRKNGAYIK